MTTRTGTQVLAFALASLVAPDVDVADVLARLLADGLDVLAADAAAILVTDAHGELSLLTTTAHQAAEIELLQIQRQDGPCVEAVRTGTLVSLRGAAEIVARWGAVGEGIVARGYSAVRAYPLCWQGRTLGAMNVFSASTHLHDEQLGQALADVAALVVVTDRVSVEEVSGRVREALAGRDVVEQAKGVLAYARGVELEEAYAELKRLSALGGQPLSEIARVVIEGRGRA